MNKKCLMIAAAIFGLTVGAMAQTTYYSGFGHSLGSSTRMGNTTYHSNSFGHSLGSSTRM